MLAGELVELLKLPVQSPYWHLASTRILQRRPRHHHLGEIT